MEKENLNEPRKYHLEKWLLPLGAAGLILWAVFTPFRSDAPALSLPREEAVEVAKQELRDKYAVDFDEWTILTSVSDNVDRQDIFAWRTGGKEDYQSLLDNFLKPPHWIIRLVKTGGEAEDRTEEFRVDVFNDGMARRVSHKIPEDQPGKNLSSQKAREIAGTALKNRYSLDINTLKEVTVSPEKLENRTDWELTYADTINYPLEQGQGRYRVKISGDEITDAYAFVHIPEEWSREYRKANSKKSVFRTIGNVLVSGTLLLGLILGIIRWTRKKFHLKIFISITLLFAAFFIIENGVGWNSLLSNYSTQIPMNNFITMMIIGLALGGIFLSLLNGIIIGVTPGWIPVSPGTKTNKLIYAVALGFLVAGIWTALDQLTPKTSPSWINFNYLNSTVPSMSAALSKLSTILVYPAFVMVLFYGIHFITRAWTSGKWIGVLIFALAGLALGALDYETLYAWIFWGVLAAVALWAIYFFFIRFHFEWIPFGFGILLLFSILREMIINPQLSIIAGGILMILISSGLLYFWSVLLIKNPEQTPPE